MMSCIQHGASWDLFDNYVRKFMKRQSMSLNQLGLNS